MNDRRIIVFGYSEVGYACLELLLHRSTSVVAVFTHEDKPGENLWFRSVAALAREHAIPVFAPDSLKPPEWEEHIRNLKPDILFSFYYRKLIPPRLLELAPLGALNLHGSLLPKYRGRAPVNWAVLNGETKTGATLHHMVERADAGDIVDQEPVVIGPEETAFEVMQKVQAAALTVLDRQLPAVLAGRAPHHAQDEHQATYFSGRKPEDGRIDWHTPAVRIFNLVRAVTRPFPGAFTDCGDARLMIWWAKPLSSSPETGETTVPGQVVSLDPIIVATGNGVLRITDFEWVQPQPSPLAVSTPPLAVGQFLSSASHHNNPLTLKSS
jgi:methionyl-tRNA formyltransferase